LKKDQSLDISQGVDETASLNAWYEINSRDNQSKVINCLVSVKHILKNKIKHPLRRCHQRTLRISVL